MIYYLVAERRIKLLRYFLQHWGMRLAPRLSIVSYEALLAGHQSPPDGGTYIFTNLGTINSMRVQDRAAISNLHDRLVAANGKSRVHNDPLRSLRRYDLLRCLYERGINTFNAYRANEPVLNARFPVFIRHETSSEYRPAIANDLKQYTALQLGMKWQSGSLDDFITVEFCDIAHADGINRKYGAFVVGDKIVPSHIFFSRDWHNRQGGITEPAVLQEELQFLSSNPHADFLLECSRLAGISYGRIDYGVLNGRPQIWEINTNPNVSARHQVTVPERHPGLLQFVAAYTEAMEAIDS